jgi:hypothetical protein
MTTRVKWEAEQSTEAEPGRLAAANYPITLHNASLGGDVAGMLPKVKMGRVRRPVKAGTLGDSVGQEPHEIPLSPG